MPDKLFRNEHKFIIDDISAELLKAKISTICMPDSHAGEDGFYDIRSLYFDSADDRFYRENLAGVSNRHKWRIRIYNSSDSRIALEKKSTLKGLKHKDSCMMDRERVMEFINGEISHREEDAPLLREFVTEAIEENITPRVIVDYRRVPFVYPVGNVRVTVDSVIGASRNFEDFFSKDLNLFRAIPMGTNVLEVKFDEVLPYTIREMINSASNLTPTAFSKYVTCFDAVRFMM